MKNKDRYNLRYLNFEVVSEEDDRPSRKRKNSLSKINLMRIRYKENRIVSQIYIEDEPISELLNWLEEDFEDF